MSKISVSKWQENPFKITLFAATPISDLNFKATANGMLNLNSIKDIYPLSDSIKLNGILTTNLNFSGKNVRYREGKI